jgi:hypothetical protein
MELSHVNLYQIKYIINDTLYSVMVEAINYDWALVILNKDADITNIELTLVQRDYAVRNYGAKVVVEAGPC